MGCLNDDLEKFLKSDGIRIIMDADGVRTEPFIRLTEADIEDFGSIDLEDMESDELERLQDQVDDLRDEIEDREPEDEDSEEHDLWEDRLSEVEDFLDDIRERLDDLEEGENE